MKTIVVPIDFSSESLAGLNMSLMLAKKCKANVQMVHVISKNIDSDTVLLEKENALAKTRFEEILQKCKESGNLNCSLNYTIKEGRIFNEIKEYREKA